MNQMFLNGELGSEGLLFDLIVTYSSLEHSGLGRYGDSLNPWADLITMAKAWYVFILLYCNLTTVKPEITNTLE
jgi:hypothetical protein